MNTQTKHQTDATQHNSTDDEIYDALLEVHRGLDLDQSTTLNARLVLLLANEVGDLERIKAIMQLAKTIEQVVATPAA